MIFFLIFMNSLLAQIVSPEMDLHDEFQQEVLRLIPIMEDRIGRTLPIPVVIYHGARQMSPAMAEDARDLEPVYDAWAGPALIGDDGKWHYDDINPSQQYCLIYIGGTGRLTVGHQRVSLIAHEIYHCFQYAKIGRFPVLDHDDWLIEGSAAFVGEYFANGSIYPQWHWRSYFSGGVDIVSTDYPAIGLWASIHDNGTRDVFRFLDQMYGVPASEGWASLEGFLNSYEKSSIASKAKMIPEWGRHYQINFPEIPAHLNIGSEFLGEIVFPSNLDLPPATITDKEFFIPLDKIIQVKGTGKLFGRVRIMEGSGAVVLDTEINSNHPVKFCRGTQCGCPNGNSSMEVIRIPTSAPSIHVYSMAYSEGGDSVQFEEVSPNCCPGSSGMDPRFVGTWALDVQNFAHSTVPPGAIEPVGIFAYGSHYINIEANGVMARTGHIFKEYKWIDHNKPSSQTDIVESNTFACMESRPGVTPDKGMIFHRNLTENSSYALIQWIQGNSVVNRWQDGEHPDIRWGTVPNGVKGSYEFNGNDELWIRGGVGGGPYQKNPRIYHRVNASE